MTQKYIDNNIEHIDDQIEYGLLRAHNTMGGMTPTLHNTFIIENNKFIKKDLIYTPALIKAPCEIIDNAIDEAIRCYFELGNVIKIDIKDNKIITVEDNGRGIPTKDDNKGNPMFVTALTNVQAGSNFRDDENNNKKGTNGIGSSMAFILSESANCITKTSDTLGVLKTKNNTRDIEFDIKNKKHTKTGTLIELVPDFKRFGVENFDDVHQIVLYSYVVNQAVCYPKIKFYFNGELVKASNFNDYIKFYNDNAYNLFESDELDIAVYPTDEYSFTYFINGLNVYDGGDALNYIVSNINNGLKSHAPKKYAKLTPSHFKNRLGYIVNYKNRTNLAWNGQTKQKCNSTYTMLESPKIDWKEVTKNLYKEKEIILPIIELFQIQEQYEAKKALKELDVVKNTDELLIDIYFPATKEKKYLVIAEGTSAKNSQMKALGNYEFGFFEARGVPANVLEMDDKKFKENKRGMPELYKIIKAENYEYILLGSDADADGCHINGLWLGFLLKYFPEKLKENKVGFLKMPLIVVRDKNDNLIETLYNFDEIKEWELKNDSSKYEMDYKKGYGSLRGPQEMDEFVAKDGIDRIIDLIEWEPGDEEIINNWLSSETVQYRKEKIMANKFDINKVV